MVNSVLSGGSGTLSPKDLMESCLDQLGAISVSKHTRSALVEYAVREGKVTWNGDRADATRRVVEMLEMVAATPDFQRE